MTIERKWEYISRRLNELGCIDMAKDAAQIDKDILELYGDVNTEAWREQYKLHNSESWDNHDNKERLLLWLATSTETCVACVQSDSCYNCKYRNYIGGSCQTNKTLQHILKGLKNLCNMKQRK